MSILPDVRVLIASELAVSIGSRERSRVARARPFGMIAAPMAGNDLPAQPVDATHALNLSAGVSKANVFRGRSFS